jgi:hypothetical protein
LEKDKAALEDLLGVLPSLKIYSSDYLEKLGGGIPFS